MRKTKCFLDTSAFIALNDAKDQYHKELRKIASILKNNELIPSDSVITETYTLLRYQSAFPAARYFLQSVITDESTIAEVTPSTRRRTLQLFDILIDLGMINHFLDYF